MERTRIAVIGCGDIAFRSYLPAIQKLDDRVELVATCDRDRARAEQARETYDAARGSTSAEEVLALPDLDGVIILTPMPSHGPLATAALESGRHVFVEKVMAVTMAEADHMVALAEEKKRVLACAPATILLSAYRRVKEMIDQGVIGRPCFAHALGAHGGPARWDEFTGDPTWFYQPGAGPLFDLAVYPLHILTQILGPVKRVSAFSALALPEIAMTAERVRGQTLRVETDDTTLMLLDFGDAVLASVDASYNMLSSRLPVMHVWGSAGALTAPQFLGDEVGSWRRENGQWDIANLPATEVDRLGIAAGLPHWLDCIRNGTRPVNDGRQARHVLDILLSVQRSASTGQAVALQTTF